MKICDDDKKKENDENDDNDENEKELKYVFEEKFNFKV